MWGSASEHVTSLLYSTEDSEDGGGSLQGFNYNVLTIGAGEAYLDYTN